MLKNIIKGFGSYRVATYCPKHGIQLAYFKDKSSMLWAIESNSSIWVLAKVQSRFLKRDIIARTY